MKRILVFCSIIVLFTFIINLSYAWFCGNDYSSINQVELNVSECEEIKISSDKENFSESLSFNFNNELIPVTSGNNNFYLPEFNIVNYEDNLTSLNIINENELNDYLFIHDFYLDSSICCVGYFDFNDFSLTSNNIYNSHNLNSNGLLGALRIGIMEQNKDDDWYYSMIIFPYSKIELNNYVLNYNGDIEEFYYFYSTNDINSMTSVETNSSGFRSIDSTLYVWDYNDLSQLAFTDIKVGINHYKLVIWLEGTDRECQNILKNDTKEDLEVSLRITLKFENNSSE